MEFDDSALDHGLQLGPVLRVHVAGPHVGGVERFEVELAFRVGLRPRATCAAQRTPYIGRLLVPERHDAVKVMAARRGRAGREHELGHAAERIPEVTGEALLKVRRE